MSSSVDPAALGKCTHVCVGQCLLHLNFQWALQQMHIQHTLHPRTPMHTYMPHETNTHVHGVRV